MVDSVVESDDDSSSSSSKIKTKSDYFGSLLRESGGKKTKMKVVHTTEEIDQVSNSCHITFV